MIDSTGRFSNRVENYVKYRPHYPVSLAEVLERRFGLNNSMTAADIGSGTGFSAELFAARGYRVFAVEPNPDMRKAAEELYPELVSIDGTAENTTLMDRSADFIIAGQAFHWFDKQKARAEFRRILKENGLVFLFWNRKLRKPGLMNQYFSLLEKYGSDYDKVKHENFDDHTIREFYSKGFFETMILDNQQALDYSGLEGRLLSSSYIPLEGDKFGEMLRELKNMFDEFCAEGKVTLEYETVIYAGRLS